MNTTNAASLLAFTGLESMKMYHGSRHAPETGKGEGVIGKDDDDMNLPEKIIIKPVSNLSESGHFNYSGEERQSSGGDTEHPTLSDEINILIVTFNIGNAPLNPTELSHWLSLSKAVPEASSDIRTPNSADPDLIVVGLQESFYQISPPTLPNTDVQQQPVPTSVEEESSTPPGSKLQDSSDSGVDDGDLDGTICLDEVNEEEGETSPAQDSMRLGAAREFASAGLGDAIAAISTSMSKPKKILRTSLQTGSNIIAGKITVRSHLKDMIRDHLGDGYAIVASCRRLQMRLRVYARKDRMPDIALDNVEIGAENTGIAGVAPNKGGLAIKFCIRGSSLAFISCHLQAHKGAENCSRRSSSVADILAGIRMGSGNLKRVDIDAQAHHTFLMGDLNFRVEPKDLRLPDDHSFDQHREHVLSLVKEERWTDIQKGDELAKELKDEKLLVGFNNVEPSFPPTFKMKRGTIGKYDSKRSKACQLLLFLLFFYLGHMHNSNTSMFQQLNSLL